MDFYTSCLILSWNAGHWVEQVTVFTDRLGFWWSFIRKKHKRVPAAFRSCKVFLLKPNTICLWTIPKVCVLYYITKLRSHLDRVGFHSPLVASSVNHLFYVGICPLRKTFRTDDVELRNASPAWRFDYSLYWKLCFYDINNIKEKIESHFNKWECTIDWLIELSNSG